MRYFSMLLVLLTCLAYKGYAQQYLSGKSVEQINQAELAIVNNQSAPAYKVYKKFSLKELRLNDLNNFYLLALERKEIEMCEKISDEIAQRGVGGKYFEKIMFAPLKAKTSFQERIKNADKWRALMSAKTKSFKDAIDSLYKVDQVVAISRTAGYQGKEIPLSILDSFDTNAAYLLGLLKEKGFPSEGNIVPEIYQDSMYYFRNNYLLMIVHCLQMSQNDSLKSECRALMLNALTDYKISRSNFLYVQDFGNLLIPESLGEHYFAYDPVSRKFWQNKSLDAEKLKSLNKARALYSIPSIHEDALKITFRYTKPEYAFDTALKTVVLSPHGDTDPEQFQELYFETNEFPQRIKQ